MLIGAAALCVAGACIFFCLSSAPQNAIASRFAFLTNDEDGCLDILCALERA